MPHPPSDRKSSAEGDATDSWDLSDADFDEVITTEPNILGDALLDGFLSGDPEPGSPDYVPSKDEERPPKTPEELLARVRSGAWLQEQVFAPLRYAIDGLIPEGLTLLVGSPKIGKSWLMLDLAIARSTPRRALGAIRVRRARPVLYLALEDSDMRMQERCQTLLSDRAIPGQFEYITEVEPGEIETTIAAWFAAHRRQQPFAIVDPYARAMPLAKPGEGVYQRDYRTARHLKEITSSAPGSSVVLVHHDRKADAEDYVETVSGSNGLTGGVDTIIVLTRPRNPEWGLLRRNWERRLRTRPRCELPWGTLGLGGGIIRERRESGCKAGDYSRTWHQVYCHRGLCQRSPRRSDCTRGR